MSLENELTEELRGTYEVARKRGYIATNFLQMLEEHDGVKTAKKLLAKQEIQQGLMRLAEIGLLKDSMEAVVLQEKYRPLFEGEETDYLGEARRRLEALDYFKDGR
jgi:hypothetical protein